MASSMQTYTITITNSIGTLTPGDGFIDPTRIENYYSYNAYNTNNFYSSSATPYAFENQPSGLTLALCVAKRRGNHRYNEMLRQLGLISNVWIDPLSFSLPGGSVPGWTPTSFTFTMANLFGDTAWVTADESNIGASLTGMACIQRCIARALVSDGFRVMDVFDPTPTNALYPVGNATTPTPTTTPSVPRFGSRINIASSLEIGPYAGSLAAATAVIAVTKLH